MKKIIFLLVFLLITVSTANAQEVRSLSRQQTAVSNKTQKLERVKTRSQEQIAAMQQKREQFKERLQEIKSERKRVIMGKIDEQLGHINGKATGSMTKVLGRMSQLLDKLENRVGGLSEIDTAREKIAETQIAVDNQAAKEYVMEFEDETGLKVGASEAKTGLRTDIKTLRELVQEARAKTTEALEAAKLVNQEE